jgi:hypothetical protein
MKRKKNPIVDNFEIEAKLKGNIIFRNEFIICAHAFNMWINPVPKKKKMVFCSLAICFLSVINPCIILLIRIVALDQSIHHVLLETLRKFDS